jgi:hypothetical protein
MTVSPAGKGDLINRIDASRQRKMWGKSYWLFVKGYWERIRRSRFFKGAWASCPHLQSQVGRRGLAAPILSEKIHRKAAKVAKERGGESDWRAQEEAASLKEGHGRPARVLSWFLILAVLHLSPTRPRGADSYGAERDKERLGG